MFLKDLDQTPPFDWIVQRHVSTFCLLIKTMQVKLATFQLIFVTTTVAQVTNEVVC